MEMCVLCGKDIDGEKLRDGTALLENNCSEEKKKSLGKNRICDPCARKEIIRQTQEELKPVYEKIHDFINKMGHDSEGLVKEAIVDRFLREHRFLQQELVFFLIKILIEIGEKSGDAAWEDDRNKFALRWCKEAGELL